MSLTLAQASTLVDATLAEGRTRAFAPLTVAVLDAGGHLVALKREDKSSLLRPQIAMAKAYGCLAVGAGGRAIFKRLQEMPAFIGMLGQLAEGNMVPGGVLLRDQSGEIVGAVGVSGDQSQNDEAAALAGAKAAGLVADHGEPAPKS